MQPPPSQDPTDDYQRQPHAPYVPAHQGKTSGAKVVLVIAGAILVALFVSCSVLVIGAASSHPIPMVSISRPPTTP